MALLAFFGVTLNQASSSEDLNAEVAGVAAKTPTLFAVVLNAKVALETLDAEIDERICTFIFERDFARKEELFVGVGVLGDSHDGQQLFHRLDVQFEVLKFLEEDVVDVINDSTEVYLASRHELAALLDVTAYFRKYKLWVNLTVSFDESVSKWGRNELSARVPKGHVVPKDNVVDMSRDRSISADAVFFHSADKVGLCQITGGFSSALNYTRTDNGQHLI